jgi:hypothetical protein
MSAMPQGDSRLDVVLSLVEREVRDGVKHGHFEYELRCEVINEKKRRLVFKAGKSHQFVISGDE